jgi:hypothetical protein
LAVQSRHYGSLKDPLSSNSQLHHPFDVFLVATATQVPFMNCRKKMKKPKEQRQKEAFAS